MPSVLYTAVNEYAEESDPLAARAVGWPVHHAASGAAVRAMPKGTFLQRGNHQRITYGHVPGLAPPSKGSRWHSDPQLGPAFASTSGDSFKLGRAGEGGAIYAVRASQQEPKRCKHGEQLEEAQRRPSAAHKQLVPEKELFRSSR